MKMLVAFGDAPTAAVAAAALSKLHRLLRFRREHEHELNPGGVRLLDMAIFASVADARDAGAGEKAHQIIREVREGR